MARFKFGGKRSLSKVPKKKVRLEPDVSQGRGGRKEVGDCVSRGRASETGTMGTTLEIQVPSVSLILLM